MLLILSRCSVPGNGPTPTSDLGGPLSWAPGSPGSGYARLPLARGVVCPDNLPLHRTDRGAWDRRRKTCRLSQALSPDRLSVPCPLIYACHHHDIYCPTYAPLPYYYYPRGGVAWVVGVRPAKTWTVPDVQPPRILDSSMALNSPKTPGPPWILGFCCALLEMGYG